MPVFMSMGQAITLEVGSLASQYVQYFNKEVIFISILIALVQNVLVDMFKAGKNTHFTQTGATLEGTQAKRWNNLMLLLSGVVVFSITLYTGDTTLKDSIIGAASSTIFAWIFYRVGIYDFTMSILTTVKAGIIQFIQSKFKK